MEGEKILSEFRGEVVEVGRIGGWGTSGPLHGEVCERF